MSELRIILVEPHEAGNVGAVARAMKNFGVSDLAIVGKDRTREDRSASWWASGAEDLIERASRFATLRDALADCHMAVATTAVKARSLGDVLYPPELAALASEELRAEHRMAVVFGREEWGLKSSEISQCQRIMAIPTDPQFPTMNLAQSVAVVCYELQKSLRPTREPRDPAPLETIQLLDTHARHIMDEVRFFAKKDADRVVGELKAISDRGGMTAREASLLLALLRKIERRMGICKER